MMPEMLAATSPLAPSWVLPLIARAPQCDDSVGAIRRSVRDAGEFVLASATFPGFTSLSSAETTSAAHDVYALLASTIRNRPANRPIRFWNHIAGIHDDMGDRHDRYMAFNAGRFAAFNEWMGGPDHFPRTVATASGIGDHGSDLTVHMLAARYDGIAVNNPRQRLPFEYSQRYGKFPPCFSRATLFGSRLMIGGTASIRGEESVYLGDLERQLGETLVNIEALTQQASTLSPTQFTLNSITDFRTYHPRREDRAVLEEMLRARFPAATFEWSPVPLCRRELLVEIEAMAIAD